MVISTQRHCYLIADIACVICDYYGAAYCDFAGKPVIKYLRTLKYGQAVRDDGPKTHLVKQGTPTMGGVLILVAIAISTLAWADLSNPYVWILMVVMVIFGAVGWADDWLKIKHKPTRPDRP